jgi:hypothetical protein
MVGNAASILREDGAAAYYRCDAKHQLTKQREASTIGV